MKCRWKRLGHHQLELHICLYSQWNVNEKGLGIVNWNFGDYNWTWWNMDEKSLGVWHHRTELLVHSQTIDEWSLIKKVKIWWKIHNQPWWNVDEKTLKLPSLQGRGSIDNGEDEQFSISLCSSMHNVFLFPLVILFHAIRFFQGIQNCEVY
jgi:hypothetical protein